MLLAIEIEQEDSNGMKRIIVDVVPCDDRLIEKGTRAFIVSISSEHAQRYPILLFIHSLLFFK